MSAPYGLANAEQKQTWWRDKLNEYFELITGSMERTQPGLREVLRSKFSAGDGYYDGVSAMAYITVWIKNSLLHNPQHEYYEKAHTIVLEKRLAGGGWMQRPRVSGGCSPLGV